MKPRFPNKSPSFYLDGVFKSYILYPIKTYKQKIINNIMDKIDGVGTEEFRKNNIKVESLQGTANNSCKYTLELGFVASKDIGFKMQAYQGMLDLLRKHRSNCDSNYTIIFKGQEKDIYEFYAFAEKDKDDFEWKNRDVVSKRTEKVKKASRPLGVLGGLVTIAFLYDTSTEIATTVAECINNFSDYLAPLTGLVQTGISIAPPIAGYLASFSIAKWIGGGYINKGKALEKKVRLDKSLLYQIEKAKNQWKVDQAEKNK